MSNSIKKRESGLELLRIITMLQIIFLHISTYGRYYSSATKLGGKHELLYWVVWLMSRCPVYIYIIITAYFFVDKQLTIENIKPRLKSVYIPMSFYAFFIPLVLYVFGEFKVREITDVLRMFVPFFSKTWYFLTLYILVIIFSPFLNKCLQQLTKKEYDFLLGVLFIIFSVWRVLSLLPPFNKFIATSSIIENGYGKSLYSFIYMYILGGYLKLHYKHPIKKNYQNLLIFMGLGLLNVGLVYIVDGYRDIISYNDNPFVVLQCVFLFMFFKNLNIESKAINTISAVNIGVYMLHEHKYAREFIWNKVFRMLKEKSFYANWYYPFIILSICVLIYVVCGIIEYIRASATSGITTSIKNARKYKPKRKVVTLENVEGMNMFLRLFARNSKE